MLDIKVIASISRWGGLALVLALCWMQAHAAPAQKQVVTEYQVKAAFLYNFAKFVEWPPMSFPTANAPLQIGVIGEDPFGEVLDRTVQNKTVNNHPLIVRRLKREDDGAGCQVVFISRSEQEHLPEILGRFKGRSTLLVGEMERFLESGGMINFYVESDSVRFAVNLTSAEHGGLSISSKLLAIAKVVRFGSPQ